MAERTEAASEGALQVRTKVQGVGGRCWNPRRKDDAVDKFFRGADVPSDAVCVKANWRDNPWFPTVLDNERKLDQGRYPERYGHIWGGGLCKRSQRGVLRFTLLQTKAVSPMSPRIRYCR